jgi:hypothetical protein
VCVCGREGEGGRGNEREIHEERNTDDDGQKRGRRVKKVMKKGN